MGITVSNEINYSTAIRQLFPQGEYWEKQFKDNESDLSLFCKAKTQEIIKFRKRMHDLYLESNYETAVETLDDWERVLLSRLNVQLSHEERRSILGAKKDSIINRIIISNIAQRYGLTLIDIEFPFKTSFFGFSQFGSIFSRPAFYSVFFLILIFSGNEIRDEAQKHVSKLLNKTSFGRGCFGIGQFLGRSFFNKEFTNRVFSDIKTLNNFENELSNKLLANSIVYYKYNL